MHRTYLRTQANVIEIDGEILLLELENHNATLTMGLYFAERPLKLAVADETYH